MADHDENSVRVSPEDQRVIRHSAQEIGAPPDVCSSAFRRFLLSSRCPSKTSSIIELSRSACRWFLLSLRGNGIPPEGGTTNSLRPPRSSAFRRFLPSLRGNGIPPEGGTTNILRPPRSSAFRWFLLPSRGNGIPPEGGTTNILRPPRLRKCGRTGARGNGKRTALARGRLPRSRATSCP